MIVFRDPGQGFTVAFLGPFLMIERGRMNGSVDCVGDIPNGFHNVDFTRSWPGSIGGRRGRHHPDRRPGAFELRHLGPDLKFPISEVCLLTTDHPRRGIRSTFMRFFTYFNRQESVFDAGIQAVSVILQFIVAPTAATGFIAPVVFVDFGTLEFIRPHQFIGQCVGIIGIA